MKPRLVHLNLFIYFFCFLEKHLPCKWNGWWLFFPCPGLHKALPGIQEGGPHWRSPNGKWPLPAPSHAAVELLWKPADERCWLRTCLIKHHLILTALYCDKQRQTDQVAPHMQSWRSWEKVQPATGGAGHRWGDLTRPPDLCQASTCLLGLDLWRDNEGMFLKDLLRVPQKHWKMTTYLEENVTGQCVQMLQMDKALKGRRETWQPAV